MSELDELYFRHNLCRAVIKELSGMDDPRKEDALAEYNRQLGEIDAKIAAIEGKPPAITIGLKPAILFPKGGSATGGLNE